MTDDTRKRLRAQLIVDEDLRLMPYTDSVGKLTIGVGRNLTDNGIRESEALFLLDHDIDEAERGLLTRYPWTADLDPVRFACLCNMRFNLGATRFAGFVNMLQHAAVGEYDKAAEHMLASKWASQVGSRATRLARMMRTGDWK